VAVILAVLRLEILCMKAFLKCQWLSQSLPLLATFAGSLLEYTRKTQTKVEEGLD
jgi:hypothetical protein